MMYQIQVNASADKDFLQIIESLKNIGVVENFEANSKWGLPGEAITESELLKALKARSAEIKEGNFFSTDELKKFLKLWKLIDK